MDDKHFAGNEAKIITVPSNQTFYFYKNLAFKNFKRLNPYHLRLRPSRHRKLLLSEGSVKDFCEFEVNFLSFILHEEV